MFLFYIILLYTINNLKKVMTSLNNEYRFLNLTETLYYVPAIDQYLDTGVYFV